MSDHEELVNTQPDKSRTLRLASVAIVVLGVVSCERVTPTQANPTAAPRAPARSVALQDAAMGRLSPIALAVAAGLQKPRVRSAVMAAMKDTAARGLGLDLQDCEPGTTTRLLFEAGEARGAESANASCALAAQMTGLVLYMEPEQLAVWSPSVIPLVTALANPGSAWPSHIAAYRSPDRSLDLAADRSLRGPILVVLPLIHPKRTLPLRNTLVPSLVAHHDPGPPRQHIQVP